jgi:L-ascorbate metabolism protein UlaG (beta-lactamase superfamily)
LGHAGFKLLIPDAEQTVRNVYIDAWLKNPTIKDLGTPDDADLILVTHGHFDHSSGAPILLNNSKKETSKIVCNYELSQFYQRFEKIDETRITRMNKGGTVDFGFCTVTMVSADHSSGCLTHEGIVYGGDPAGFVVSANGISVYHAGDTNIFSGMDLITEIYAPTHALIPIGGHSTMGPNESALAVSKFLTSVKVIIPMHFGTFPFLKGTVEEFESCLIKHSQHYGREIPQIIDPNMLVQGKDF